MMFRTSLWLVLVSFNCLVSHPGWGQDPPPGPGAAEPDPLRELFAPPRVAPLDPAWLAGLPAGSKAESLTWERVYNLALIRARSTQPPRFDELDLARLADEAKRVNCADFARLRGDFAPGTKFREPAADFLSLQARLMEIQNAHGLVAWQEAWVRILTELINGEASGLNLTDLDQSHAATAQARRSLDRSIARYRDGLETFKVTLGLAPGAAVTVDTSGLAAFSTVAGEIARWSSSPQRQLADLAAIVGRYPALGDVTIEGRSILADLEADPNRLAAILDRVARLAIDHYQVSGAAADATAVRVRRAVRHLAEIRTDYLLELRQAVLTLRLLDDAFEQIIAPPAGPPTKRPALGVMGLTLAANQSYANRNRLVTLWTTFHAERLALYDDLGILPFDDWPAFLGQFTAQLQPPQTQPPVQPLAPVLIPGEPIMPAPPPAPAVRAIPLR